MVFARLAFAAFSLLLSCSVIQAKENDPRISDYRTRILQRLNVNKLYPVRADRDCQVRTTFVKFSFDDDGVLTFVKIIKPSGLPDFDKAAIMTVQRAQPFPRRPPGLPANSVFAVPLRVYPGCRIKEISQQ